jgi:Tfp pilus assembly protein FimV
LSRLLIAAPIWAYHWQRVQQVARREDEIGHAERASGPRKVYLYGVALAGGLIILYYLAQVAYRLLLLLLGDPTATFVGAGPAGDLARSAIAAVIWIVHVMAIRRDAQMGAEPLEEAPAAVARDERRASLEARIAQLENELSAARAELAVLAEAE